MVAFDMADFDAKKAVGFVANRKHVVGATDFHNGKRTQPVGAEFVVLLHSAKAWLVEHDFVTDGEVDRLSRRVDFSIMKCFLGLLGFFQA